jgi:hypothetical protein
MAPSLSALPAVQGMLAIGAALLGSGQVIGVDVDPDALALAQENCGDFEDPLPVRRRPGALALALALADRAGRWAVPGWRASPAPTTTTTTTTTTTHTHAF